ncbi:MAG: LytTR family DNA-binding domain-containing protein [Lachnospiraceae bacterium]
MSKFYHYTKQEVVAITKDVIHFFANKQMNAFMTYLDSDFVWMGDYDVLYTHGISAFADTIAEEIQEAPVRITEEEYTLLSHERKLWVTYGRFTMTGEEDNCNLIAKVHFTFVWTQKEDDLKLLLANATHVKFLPASEEVTDLPPIPQTKIFDQRLLNNLISKRQEKLSFLDTNGTMHFLYPANIIYIKADDKLCTICTDTGSFSSRIRMKDINYPHFLQIHRSYIINRQHLQSLKRYKAILSDGTTLPVGRDRYPELKQSLTSV